MCGITGIMAYNLIGKFHKIHVTNATMALAKRGPDVQDIYLGEWVALGHRRLSIIDTSEAGHQPMWDESRRYCIVYNGEIFNFKELRKTLESKNHVFTSQSDTEVLLKLYIEEKENCLSKLNGFFAFCIYDAQEQTFFLARDRYGIKPLYYVSDEDKFIFGSEMKAILQYGLEKGIDFSSLYTYLQINYIPGESSIFTQVKKLLPGHYLKVGKKLFDLQRYYAIPRDSYARHTPLSYDGAQNKLKGLMDDAVQARLVSDVPLGAFLSGGIDSSIIAALAKRHKPDLHTFSIGFKDNPFFDETRYALQVARHLKTEHTVFSLTQDDLYGCLFDVLDYMDEPFADSSALAVYLLSKETRKHSTVALSGDGADEIFGGYNKHLAHVRAMHPGFREHFLQKASPLLSMLPQSRNSPFANKVRQALRFVNGMKLSPRDRYWSWAGFATKEETMAMFHPELRTNYWLKDYFVRQKSLLENISDPESINDILYTDMNLVLPGDMLTKVDRMSMANGLEVRVPFLDYRVVDFAFSLPGEFKVDRHARKKILQDSFRDLLPSALYNRPKKGFEVPLLKWLRKDLKDLIMNDLLSKKRIEQQGIFYYPEIERMKAKLYSSRPGDIHARIWGLVAFQWWFKKHIGNA